MRGFKAVMVLTAAAVLVLPVWAEAGTADARGHGTETRVGAAATPAGVAKRLFKAWLARDRAAAGEAATPAAVRTLFAYAYRAPDRFAGCQGNTCRFVHTSVRVPGGLNGVLMVVGGDRVAKVYESRHLTTADRAAKHLYGAWRAGDRNRALEIATTAVVKKLFRTRSGGPGHIFQGCQPEKGGKSCAYSYEGGAMFLHAKGNGNRGYEIRSISYIAD